MSTRHALIAANLAALAFSSLSWTSHGISLQPYRLDLEIYRIGGRVWLSGGNLYGALPATSEGVRLPFTYPPFAAIALSPLSLIPMVAANLVITVGTIAALAVTLRAFVRPVAWPLTWLLPVALLLEPVRSTIIYGQVNVLLMALVATDCLAGDPSQPGIPGLPGGTHRAGRPEFPRGLLAGLAAAVKLTPALFVLYFLLRRNYRAAGVMTATFLAATGFGFLLAPRDSMRYWTSAVFDTRRIGGLAYAGNQNIVGVLARAGLGPGTIGATFTWLGLSILVLVVACRGMRRAFAVREDSLALTLNAFVALLVSPVSWSHHWVWAGMALLVLAILGRQRRLRVAWVTAVAGLVIFAASPQWWFPHGANREMEWTVWQQAVGSSYMFFAAFVLLLCSRLTLTRPVPRSSHRGGACDPGQPGVFPRAARSPVREREQVTPAPATITLDTYVGE